MNKEEQAKYTPEAKIERIKEISDSIKELCEKIGDDEITRPLINSVNLLIQYINLIDAELIALYHDTLKYYDYKVIKEVSNKLEELHIEQDTLKNIDETT